jgi:hypothetical protein
MNVVSISARAALSGSVVGGLTSGATTWMNMRAQARAARRAHHVSRQEELFTEFICAASKTYAEAIQSNEPKVEDLVALYGMISRMRVGSSAKAVACAEKILDITISAYCSPNKEFTDLRELIMSGKGMDPLKEFAEIAREELGELNP